MFLNLSLEDHELRWKEENNNVSPTETMKNLSAIDQAVYYPLAAHQFFVLESPHLQNARLMSNCLNEANKGL